MPYSSIGLTYNHELKQFVNDSLEQRWTIPPHFVDIIAALMSSWTGFYFIAHRNTLLIYSRNQLWMLDVTGTGSLTSRPIMNAEHMQYFNNEPFKVSIDFRVFYAWQSYNMIYVGKNESNAAPFIVKIPDDYIAVRFSYCERYMMLFIAHNPTTSERYKIVVLDDRHGFGAILHYCYKIPETDVVYHRGDVYRIDGTKCDITYEHKVRSFVEIIY